MWGFGVAGNLVVVGFLDGRRVKGTTLDFQPNKDVFHLISAEGEAQPIRVADLKGIFFVKGFGGDPKRQDSNEFQDGGGPPGRKILLVFTDGEELLGTTQGYNPARKGFFVVPADVESNNLRIFVLAAAVRSLQFV
jgi:hypothetical protein